LEKEQEIRKRLRRGRREERRREAVGGQRARSQVGGGSD
jgi:hypothetical protein